MELQLVEFKQMISKLQNELIKLHQTLKIDELQVTFDTLQVEMAQADFWDDIKNAQSKSNQHSQVSRTIDGWKKMDEELADLEVMSELLEMEFSQSEFNESTKKLARIQKEIETLSLAQLFSGEFDHEDVYVELHSGEGGVEAMDFTQMLYRMYTRWCEQMNFTLEVLAYQAGEEAGIKSATLYIKGTNAFGMLKSEAGVHRLVRLSPFDSAKRRHTSFASITITPDISGEVEVDINENDLKIDTYRASGAGGQHVNTTDSAVRITHLPTGIVVTCQNERSQIKNREQAMKMLKAKLYEVEEAKKKDAQEQATSEKKLIGFGSQIRSYVLHPYQMVKDHRTNTEIGNVSDVLDGNLEPFINSFLHYLIEQ